LKNVTIGKIPPLESFGEYSILREQPMECTVKTVTAVELAVIDAAALKGSNLQQQGVILFYYK